MTAFALKLIEWMLTTLVLKAFLEFSLLDGIIETFYILDILTKSLRGCIMWKCLVFFLFNIFYEFDIHVIL